jgi:hypothetical protein
MKIQLRAVPVVTLFNVWLDANRLFVVFVKNFVDAVIVDLFFVLRPTFDAFNILLLSTVSNILA